MSEPVDSPPPSLKALLHGFIRDRFQTKTEKLAPDDPAYLKLQQQFEPQAWLADAARRVSQLQVVTHSLKAIHPDAKGTNLYVEPGQLERSALVGSHCLPVNFDGDVVGNAAALDVYKFLKLQWEGRSLLERALEGDKALIEALSDDCDEAQSWVQAFADIVEPKGTPSSHARGKQLYWLVGDDPCEDANYRLLSPLYATALAHPFYAQLSEARFGERAKAGRKARRDNAVFEGGYADYLNLAVQKFGGTKPQNISQLNSERGGQNYLLASLPPHWQSRDVYPPMRDAFQTFGRRQNVRRTLDDLKRFLESDPAANMHTRDLRDDLTAMLVDELMLFTFDIHSIQAGWTTDERCQLAPEEQYWLDPGRAEQDVEFAEARRKTEWHEDIRQRAAVWLNRALNRKSSLNLGDVEHEHWKNRFDGVLKSFRRQLDDLQDVLRDDDEAEGDAA
ncbi:type I-F CRISPR-associated protein Csy1 [Kushneria konosiri]|uniref:Type I-F CRISPR-associated protein Csy1 n=1 Tax=Kushneria konosiri TaxID=698828 RepID=A0A2Z2HAM6_9GAMM|nr:type I-F CRISPR-associated protein Csy1 [Kushneria konosiri]ARS54512.1 type I-F CRISPR-associated protein Csy1 [Kushneria konosiri]